MILLSGTMTRIYVFDVSVFAQVNMEATTIQSITNYMDTRFYTKEEEIYIYTI